jgi:hypothetical protein
MKSGEKSVHVSVSRVNVKKARETSSEKESF